MPSIKVVPQVLSLTCPCGLQGQVFCFIFFLKDGIAMLHTRASGVLMALSSLPSRYGIGVCGEETKRFILKIKEMGFSYWQVLPLVPPDFFGSPYASEAAFAISPLYICPDTLLEMGLISAETLERNVYYGSPYTADYEFAQGSRRELLRAAFQNIDDTLRAQVRRFKDENRWCGDYALYAALKEKFGGKPWYAWDEPYRFYETAVEHAEAVADLRDFYCFEQYIAHTQWCEIKQFANEHGVKILGDMPIYVSFDSANVWSNRHLFEIDARTCVRKRVSGVPPDYFSADGQLWGNPLYDWVAMEKDNYRWWCDRIARARELYDTVRIDHFRAFASYWAVPAESETAKNGVWEKGPGKKLFDAIFDAFGEVPIVAEDLGTFGEDVVELLQETEFPGMRVIQFGFSPDCDSTHLPHNYPQNCVAYVGTHDNTTLLAWLWEATERDRRFALDYCGFDGENWGEGGFQSPACRKIIETVFRSPARLAVLSFQDLCGFGSDARMNVPGRAFGNWLFRTTEETVEKIDTAYYQKINRLFKR